jgi:hypothetical protein
MKNPQKKYRNIDRAGMADLRGGSLIENPAYSLGYLISFGITWLIKSAARSYENFYPVILK